jgi:hypothetical protein
VTDAEPELPPFTFTEAGVCHFATWRNVSVGVWVGRANLEAARGLFLVGGQMTRRFPGGHSAFVFVQDQVAAPAPEAEDLVKRAFGLGSDLANVAFVLEGSGLWASALRRVLEKMHRAGRGNAQIKIGRTSDELLGWFVEAHERATSVHLEREATRATLQRMRDEGAKLALRSAP